MCKEAKSKDSNLKESIDLRVKTESLFIRGVFRTQSNIYDGENNYQLKAQGE